LRPYSTATDAVFAFPTALSATDIPIPSPTPSTYKVVSGDTLGTIAEHFGLRLAELQAANPGVVSEALIVGQKLNIPAASTGANALPTPAPAQVGAVTCYPSGGGSYCLVAVRNPFPDTLENVKLQMTLLGANGRALNSLEAFLPLDILPPGSVLPAYAFFPAPAAQATPAAGAPPAGTAPLTGTAQASAQLAIAIRLVPGDVRYLPAVARNVLVSVDWDGRSARVQGQVFLPVPSAAAKTLWLAGVAYDGNGQIVGFRRWEWQGSLQAGSAQAFDFSVYSLGPAIARVEVIVEARP
jgi:LysM repeat protein